MSARRILAWLAAALLGLAAFAAPAQEPDPRLAVAAAPAAPLPVGIADPLTFHSGLVEMDGRLTMRFQDVGLPARGWPVELVRTWRDGAPDTGLGPGWAWSFGVAASRDPDTGDRQVAEDDGSVTVYRGGAVVAGRLGTTLAADASVRTWRDGTVERFDADGRLTARDGADGPGYRLVRDGETISINVDDTPRLILRLSDGRLSEARDVLGRVWSYAYADGRLDQMVDPLGRTTRYRYDAAGRLAAVTLADGTGIAVERDIEGRVSRIAGPGPAATLFAHRGSAGEGRFVQTRTDATGRTTRLEMARDRDDPDRWSFQAIFADGSERVTDFGPGTIDIGANGRWIGGADTDASGGLAAVFDDRGMRLDLARTADAPGAGAYPDANGMPRLALRSDGSTAWAEYDAAGRLVARYGAEGGIERFVWDEGDRLTEWTDAAGGTQRLEWDAGDRLLRWTEPGGRTTRWTYDEAGRLTSVVRDGLAPRDFAYDAAGRLSAFDADGRHWTVAFDAAGRPLTLTDDVGAVVMLHWDDTGRLAGMTDEAGNTVDLAGAGAGRYADALGRSRTLTVEPDGSTLVQEPLGLVTAVTPLPGGDRRVERGAPDGTGVVERVDAAGNLIAAEIVTAAPLALETDGAGRVLRYGDPDAAVAYGYDDAGRLTERVGPTGIVTAFGHDEAGRLTSVASPLASAAIAYDAAGRPVRIESEDGTVSEREYDALGRIVLSRETDRLGIVREERLHWDEEGRLAAVEASDGTKVVLNQDGAGRVGSIVETQGAERREWTMTYDAAGRVISVAEPDGTHRTIDYDEAGNVAGWQSATQLVTLGWDADGLIASATIDGVPVEAGLGPLGGPVREDRQQQPDDDGAVRVMVVEDRGGGVWTLGYDGRGRLMRAADPLGGVTRVARDAAGQPLGIVDPGGRRHFTTYDDLGRPVAAGVQDGWAVGTAYAGREPVGLAWSGGTVLTAESDAATHTMSARIGDTLVSRRTFDARGRLVSVEGPDGTSRFEYDDADRIVAEIDAQGRRLGYRYDTLGRLVALVLPEGDEIGYTYDESGRAGLQTGPDGVESVTRFADLGRTASVEVGDQAIELALDADALVEGVTVASAGAGGRLAITRDGSDAVTSVERDGVTTRYAYDPLGRLVGADDGAYAYDPSGDLTGAPDGLARSYDQAYRLTALGADAPVWDADGRLAQLGPRHFTWDALGRLVGIATDAGPVVTLRYDPMGRLAERIEDGRVERYLYAGDRLLAVYDGEGKRVALLERNALIPDIVRLHTDAGVRTLVPDQRGTPTFALDDTGVEALPQHGPWGETADGMPDYFRWAGFGGMPEDPASGLVLYPHRPYWPAIQRFLAPDPSGLGGGLNPYAFAGNDPIGRRDAGGLQPTLVGIGPSGTLPHTLPGWGRIGLNDDWRSLQQVTDFLEQVANGTPGPAADVARDTVSIIRNTDINISIRPAALPNGAIASVGGGNMVFSTDALRSALTRSLGRAPSAAEMQAAMAGLVTHEVSHVGQRLLPDIAQVDRGFRELEANLRQVLIDPQALAFGRGAAADRAAAVRNAFENAIGRQWSYHVPGSAHAPYLPGTEGLYQVDEKVLSDLIRRTAPDVPLNTALDELVRAHEAGRARYGGQVLADPAEAKRFDDFLDRLRNASADAAAGGPAAAATPPPPAGTPPAGSGTLAESGAAPREPGGATPAAEGGTPREPTVGAGEGGAPREPSGTTPTGEGGTPREPGVATPTTEGGTPREPTGGAGEGGGAPREPGGTPHPSAEGGAKPTIEPPRPTAPRPAGAGEGGLKPTIEPPPPRRPTISYPPGPEKPTISYPPRGPKPTIEPPRNPAPPTPSGTRPTIEPPKANAPDPFAPQPSGEPGPAGEGPKPAGEGGGTGERPRPPAGGEGSGTGEGPRPAGEGGASGEHGTGGEGPRPPAGGEGGGAGEHGTGEGPRPPAGEGGSTGEHGPAGGEGPRRPAGEHGPGFEGPRPPGGGEPHVRPPELHGEGGVHPGRPPRVLPPDAPHAPHVPEGAGHWPTPGQVFGHALHYGFAALDIYNFVHDLDRYWSGEIGHREFWTNTSLTGLSYLLPWPLNGAIAAHQLGSALGAYLGGKLAEAARNGDPVARALIEWLRHIGFINANDPTFVAVGLRDPPRRGGPAGPAAPASAAVPDGLGVTVSVDTRLVATAESWSRTDRPEALVAGAAPAGADLVGTWRWRDDVQDPAGAAAHRSEGDGVDLHYLLLPAPVAAAAGEHLVQYLRIDPDDRPDQIALQVYDDTLSAAHRISFGADVVVFDDTSDAGLVAGGAVPPAGGWLRLSIPVDLLGLAGRGIRGIGFATAGGRVDWGRTTMSGADDLAPLLAGAADRDVGGRGDAEILVAMDADRPGRLVATLERADGSALPLFDAAVPAGRRVAVWQGPAEAAAGGTVRVRLGEGEDAEERRVPLAATPALVARIVYPPEGAVVRQTVPIFGAVGGPAFERYVVDVRPEGAADDAWTTVIESTLPSAIVLADVEDRIAQIMARNLRGTVYGNLASLRTGSRLHSFPFGPADPPAPSGRVEVRLRAFAADGSTAEDRVGLVIGEVGDAAQRSAIDSPDGAATLTVPPFALPRGLAALSLEAAPVAAVADAPAALSSGYVAGPAGLAFAGAGRIAIAAAPPADTIVAVASDGSWSALPTRRDGDRLSAATSGIGIGETWYAAATGAVPAAEAAVAPPDAAPWPATAPAPGLVATMAPAGAAHLVAGPIPLSPEPVLILGWLSADLSHAALVLRSGTDARLVPLASAPGRSAPSIAAPLRLAADGQRHAAWVPLAALAPPGATAIDAIDLVSVGTVAWNTLSVQPLGPAAAGILSAAVGTRPPPGPVRAVTVAGRTLDLAGRPEGWAWLPVEGQGDRPALIDETAPAATAPEPADGARSGGLTVAATIVDTGAGVDPASIAVTVGGTALPVDAVRFDPATGRMEAALGAMAGTLGIADGVAVEVAVTAADLVGNRMAAPLRWRWTWKAEPVAIGPLVQLTTDGGQDAVAGPGGAITYVAAVDGRTDLFRKGEGVPERLTDDAAIESSPTLQPAGDGVAYLSGADLVWRHASGEVARLATGVAGPAWWDASRLVAGRGDRLVAIGVDGTETVLCAAATGSTVERPRPGADGIVFTQSIYHDTVWLCDPATGAARPLSRDLDDPALRERDGIAGAAGAAYLVTGDGRGGLWRVPTGGGERTLMLAPAGAADLRPSLAPDGAAIVFDSDRTGRREVWRLALPRAPRFAVTPSVASPSGGVQIAVSLGTDIAAAEASLAIVADDGSATREVAAPAALVPGDHRWTVPADGLAAGVYSVEARLDDLVVRAPLLIDGGGPVVALYRAGDGRAVTPDLALDETDALLVAAADPSGIAALEVAAAPDAWRPYGAAVPVSTLAGPSLGVRATDRAGNVTLVALPLHLDRPPPPAPEPIVTPPLTPPPPEPPSEPPGLPTWATVLIVLAAGGALAAAVLVLSRRSRP